MNLIINKINFIKCIYKIEKKDIGKEIIIINDEYCFFNIIISIKKSKII